MTCPTPEHSGLTCTQDQYRSALELHQARTPHTGEGECHGPSAGELAEVKAKKIAARENLKLAGETESSLHNRLEALPMV
jgi:hypothetical protein